MRLLTNSQAPQARLYTKFMVFLRRDLYGYLSDLLGTPGLRMVCRLNYSRPAGSRRARHGGSGPDPAAGLQPSLQQPALCLPQVHDG